jgi:hypothetical protein
MTDVTSVLEVICLAVGAFVLYSAVMIALWATVVRAVRGGRATAGPPEARRPDSVRPGGGDRRARSWDELPAWLARDREWAVAVVLLGAPEIRDRTEPFVDFRRRRIDWEMLLAAAARWRPNERLLVASAHELASGPGRPGMAGRPAASMPAVTLADLTLLLDEEEIRRVNAALEVRRGRVAPGETLALLGGAGR